jgi:hypothetical protein
LARRAAGSAAVVAVVLGVAAGAAPVVHGSPASHGAAACSSISVDGGKYLGRLTLRLVLFGPVTCDKAHRLVRAYFRKYAAGQCGKDNNFCNLSFAGGWTCSFFSAGESQTAGGAFAGCARSAHTKIRLYKRRP